MDVLLVVRSLRTGGGKTRLFYGYTLLLKELSKMGISENPVLIVIYGLEEEMALLLFADHTTPDIHWNLKF